MPVFCRPQPGDLPQWPAPSPSNASEISVSPLTSTRGKPPRPSGFSSTPVSSTRWARSTTVILPAGGDGSGGDRDATFPFLHHPVGHGSTVVDLAHLVDDTGVEENPLGRGGFPRVDVSGDTDISDAFEGEGAGHCGRSPGWGRQKTGITLQIGLRGGRREAVRPRQPPPENAQ